MAEDRKQESAVKVNDLSFRYPTGAGIGDKGPWVLRNISLSLPRGAMCVCVGGNGAGKSTLLRAIGGEHMLFPSDSVLVLGKQAFGDRTLNRKRRILQNGWARRTVSFAGSSVPYSGDFAVEDMNKNWQQENPERSLELQKILRLNLSWRMNHISEGQKRRVQLYLALVRPFEVLLLDEVLSCLDVVVRQDFLNYLKKECLTRNATVIYATHIFDGLYDWPTHLIYMKLGGKLGYCGQFSPEKIPLLQKLIDTSKKTGKMLHSPILRLVELWIRSEIGELDGEDERTYFVEEEQGTEALKEKNSLTNPQFRAGGYTSGRLSSLLD